MRTVSLLAATALLGSASAGVHKLKLNKVPLSEQFVGLHCSPSLLPSFSSLLGSFRV